MKNEINETILNKDDFYIVAVSGGPDSMFLLNQLYKKKYNIAVCHVNYQKRANSNLDEILVKKYCTEKKIQLFTKRITEKDYQQYKLLSSNFQEIARLMRYDFFAHILLKVNAQAVLIAHNLTDHIETFLMQKQRNNKLTYYGLNAKTIYDYKDKTISIIRPMLNIKRDQIISTLKLNNIDYILDYTNDLDIYQRNRIRKDIINDSNIDFYLSEINKNNEELFLQIKQINTLYSQIIIDNKIDLNFFLKLQNDIQEKIVFNYFKTNGLLSKIIKLKKQRLKELVKQLNSNKPNIFFQVDKQITIVKSFKWAFFIKNNVLKTNTVTINFAKSFNWNNFHFEMVVKSEKLNEQLTQFNHFYLSDSDFPITITNDINIMRDIRINENCVNRYFINNKIPIDQRFLKPIIFNKNNIFILVKDNKINNLYLKQQSYLFMIK